MFKNLTFFSIAAMPASFDGLDFNTFTPCAASQEKSSGWVPPRGHDNGALVETVAGQHILKLMTETKPVPAEVVARRTKERLAQIMEMTGRKPGKKETRDIRDDVFMELLPMAFPKQVATLVWIDPVAKLLAVDSASQSRVDDVTRALVQSLDGLDVQYISTKRSPAGSMAEWLANQEAPADFTVDRECELRACDESKAVVKYGRHPLDIEEVRQHIEAGKMPTRLAMTYRDRVSFVLTDAMTFRKVEILDVAMMGDKGMTLENDAFDADVTIATAELRALVTGMVEALGGQEGGAL